MKKKNNLKTLSSLYITLKTKHKSKKHEVSLVGNYSVILHADDRNEKYVSEFSKFRSSH